jgi:hypothetical protein
VFRLNLFSRIEIAASPTRIWEVLTDFKAYPHWNPAIPRAEGEAKAGSTLRVRIQWPGLKSRDYQLEVLDSVPERELRWVGHFGMKGLMDGDHRFVIQPTSQGATVAQTESFSGVLIPFFAPWLMDNVLRGFDQVNEALKSRAEESADEPSGMNQR